MSEEVQLTRRRNQITDLHNRIKEKKEENKLLNAKHKAYQQVMAMFKQPDFDRGRSDDFIRETIMRC